VDVEVENIQQSEKSSNIMNLKSIIFLQKRNRNFHCSPRRFAPVSFSKLCLSASRGQSNISVWPKHHVAKATSHEWA